MAPVTDGGTKFDPVALERTEARFWREIWDAAPEEVAAARGLRRAVFGPIQATITEALPEARTMNLLLGAANPDSPAERFLAEAIDWVRDRGARGFALVDSARPGGPEAEAALAAAGYERADGWMRFVRDAHPPRFKVAEEVDVVEVEGSGESPFGTIAALGLGLPAWTASLFAALPSLPDWRCYLARQDGEPGACAAMLLDGEVAELGLAATLEGDRRQGCQLALLGRRIEDAAAAGARTLFAETGERVPGRPSTSYGNLLRAGFEEAYLCRGWTDARSSAS